MSVRVEHGDCREVVARLADNSVDAICTDPPYSLVSIQKRFGKPGSAAAKDRDGLYRRASAGFMGQQWDTGETAFDPAWWAEALRVLKPGGHLVAFSGTRTYHRMACAIEDAGFEIRDQLAWCYGSGFPKSHDVRRGIDRMPIEDLPDSVQCIDDIRRWEGWGTALKPAWEPIALARKPLGGTVAENVLQHGTGAINIDGCRIPGQAQPFGNPSASDGWRMHKRAEAWEPGDRGRWPANLLHDGSDEVLTEFARYGERASGAFNGERRADKFRTTYGEFKGTPAERAYAANSGTAARFFFSAKADADDRCDSKHPTVKPVALMRWLTRLVTSPGGLVLDPFAGSGTTGVACIREGFDCILIEREAQYVRDIRHRLDKLQGLDAPLFAGAAL